MSSRLPIPSDWIELKRAPFVARCGIEPSDHDLVWEAEWCRELAIAPRTGELRIDWESAIVWVSLPCAEDEFGDADDDPPFITACFHPARFQIEAPRLLGEAADELAPVVSSFWLSLVGRFNRLVAEQSLEIQARGGPRQASHLNFRWVPPDVWASSVVDWAAGTCVTPDGETYFSIHAVRPGAARAQVGRRSGSAVSMEERVAGPTELPSKPPSSKGKPMSRREAAIFIGMSMSWMEKRRDDPSNPPFEKIGKRAVYFSNELEAWLATDKAARLKIETA
ncbi:helix-turn-helix transcriptional regulator [Methylobacterium fujisawaense]|uniref:helix-turn-helix transcriptional regulator n=1 Tax=Methylobacterium fujisawaense TaxID=107400 RepID=UPI00313B8286